MNPEKRFRNVLVILAAAVILLMLGTTPAGAGEVTVQSFTELNDAISLGGVQTIFVMDDIPMQSVTIPAGSDITLKPSGKSVTLSFVAQTGGSSDPAFIRILKGGNLTLSGNSEYTLTIKGSTLSGNLVPLIENRRGNLTIEEGAVITGNTISNGYAGIENKGYLEMNGGLISNCQGTDGGAVSLVEASAVFVMTGGKISGNSAAGGSGLYITDGAKFMMSGGRISGNTGYDVCLSGDAPPTALVSVSGGANIGSFHFLNEGAGAILSFLPIHVASGFSGSIGGISVEMFVDGVQIAEFSSAADTEALQGRLSTASAKYQLTPSGNTLVLGIAPGVRFVPDAAGYTIRPGYNLEIPVSLEVVNTKVSLIKITASAADGNGNPVDGLTYSYTVKEPNPFSVTEKNGAVLTLSTGTDITNDIDQLFILAVEDTETLQADISYTVSLTVESSVSNAEDYTVYPQQNLQVTVEVVPFIIDKDDNIDGTDKFGNTVWSFAKKASVTYIIPPVAGTLNEPWPTISRNASAQYQSADSELSTVSVYKSAMPYNPENPKEMRWDSATSMVRKTDNGKILFVLAPADADAACFKLVFTGRKLGDVVEGTGDFNSVNMYDIDMILHAAVDSARYIKPVWRLYADADADGLIQLSDAITVLNLIRGYA